MSGTNPPIARGTRALYRSPAAGFLYIAVVLSLPLSPALGDLVVLKDGLQLRGRVIDLGRNAIELQQRNESRRRVYLKDIREASFEVSDEGLQQDKDVVFRKNGSEISGDARYSEDGRTIVVTTSEGGRESQMIIARDDVTRVVFRDQARSESASVYTAKVRDEVAQSLAAIAGGKPPFDEAIGKLESYGIFAIGAVREARKKAAVGSSQAAALDRPVRLYHFKEITPDALQDLPDFYRILTSGSIKEKNELLVQMFTLLVAESALVAKAIVLDPGESPEVRANAVSLLGQNGLNRELIEIYNSPQGGQVQLASAIAMARNQVLLGAESLIQALEMDRPEVRGLAFRILREGTGKDFGFGVHDTPSARKEAIVKWKAWWTENKEAIRSQSTAVVSGTARPEDGPERKKAVTLWQEGCAFMELGRYPEAESRLRTALRTDPTFYHAQISLAVVLYLHRNKGEEGRTLLQNLMDRRPPGMGTSEVTLVHHYLGRAWELAGNPQRAELEFQAALSMDPEFFRAAIALGDLKFHGATLGDGAVPDDRRALLGEAERQYHGAIRRIDTVMNGIEVLSMTDLPPETPPSFERQVHNQNVIELRASLRQLKAEAHFNIAKIRSLLEDRPRAVSNVTSAVETLGDDRDGGARELLISLLNYKALLLEEAGEPVEALKNYRAVLRNDLDPRNAAALEGVRRISPRRAADGAQDREGRGTKTTSGKSASRSKRSAP